MIVTLNYVLILNVCGYKDFFYIFFLGKFMAIYIQFISSSKKLDYGVVLDVVVNYVLIKVTHSSS